MADGWPTWAMSPGARVTIVQYPSWAGPWAVEFRGEIDDLIPPEPVENFREGEGELAYWVSFDEPQYDSSGDGPFRKAWIWGRYLKSSPVI